MSCTITTSRLKGIKLCAVTVIIHAIYKEIVMNIDFNKLRKDLEDDRYAASFAGIPEMIMEAWEIESLSDEELLDMARKEHINLRKYEQ